MPSADEDEDKEALLDLDLKRTRSLQSFLPLKVDVLWTQHLLRENESKHTHTLIESLEILDGSFVGCDMGCK